jgi:hypothetical protein
MEEQKQKKITNLQKVIDFMQGKEKCNYKDIAIATGVMKHVVGSLLSVGAKKGTFVKVDKGCYKLA